MTVVVDASSVVALLVSPGPEGVWAAEGMTDHDLVAPHLMPFEVANILRRHAAAGLLGTGEASLAHADLLDLPLDLVSYEAVAADVWRLRHNLTAYDASYVALAAAIDAPLLTLDQKLAGAPNLPCQVHIPPADA